MVRDELFMQRCLFLSRLGEGYVAPNPMVGAVLVYEDRIIAEGYHQVFGGPHAEVNCLNAVSAQNKPLIKDSTLYVSLEPCAHYGKTPPCCDLIIRNHIKKVVVGIKDPFAKVNGLGIAKMREAGIEVVVGVLEKECRHLNRRFLLFHTKKRPYIVLKWAQTANYKMAELDSERRLFITGDLANRLVHKWRSEEMAIMVGRVTAQKDDPLLDNRYWMGQAPIRMVIDPQLRLPSSLHLFTTPGKVLLFNALKDGFDGDLHYIKIDPYKDILPQIMHFSYMEGIQSILVEGGSYLLRALIDDGLWDEARVLTNKKAVAIEGLSSPSLKDYKEFDSLDIHGDHIQYFWHEYE